MTINWNRLNQLKVVENGYIFEFPSFQVYEGSKRGTKGERKVTRRGAEGNRKLSGRGADGDPASSPLCTIESCCWSWPRVAKTNKKLFFCRKFLDISEPKLLNLRPLSFPNFSLSNRSIWLWSFVYWTNRTFKNRPKNLTDTHTCGYHDSKTESTRRADAVKSQYWSNTEWKKFWKLISIQVPGWIGNL